MTYSDRVNIEELEEILDEMTLLEFFHVSEEAGYNTHVEDMVPDGPYCYDRKDDGSTDPCRFWEQNEEGRAFCRLIEETDSMLLDDQVKICDINKEYKNKDTP